MGLLQEARVNRRTAMKIGLGFAGGVGAAALTGRLAELAFAQQGCPTDAEMQRAFGFDTKGIKPVFTGTESEPAKWTLQAAGVGVFKEVPFLKDWQLTVTLPDGTVEVWKGDGKKRDITGATLRYVPTYPDNHWVRDDKDLLAHEFNFGWGQGRDPRYITRNGNLDVPEWQDYDGSTCPVNTVQTAALVGGSYKNWTEPDWDGGAWVFKAELNQYYLLTASQVPAHNSWIDYWNGQKKAADKLINWATLALNEASFHCHPVAS
jgi:hypothetical protein